MALSRIKTWGAEVLTFSDLNAEFNNILNNPISLISPFTGNVDGDGFSILDLGALIVGRSASLVTAGAAHPAQFLGTSAATTGEVHGMFAADAVGSEISFAKSRNASIGSHTIVVSGDDLGSITAYGSNGTTFDPAAQILFEVGGTPGASADMPGQIVFKVTPNASATLATAVTISQDKSVAFAGAITAITGGNLTYDNTTLSVTTSSGVSTTFNATNSAIGPAAIGATGGGVTVATLVLANSHASGDNIWTQFYEIGNLKGSIDYNRGGNAVRYNTSSDAELKNIIGDATTDKSLSILRDCRPREFAWKNDPTQKKQIGFIAQELYEVYKGAVVPGRGEPGDEDYSPWMMDKTAFVNHLVIGWQEHERQIAELRALVASLEAKLQ